MRQNRKVIRDQVSGRRSAFGELSRTVERPVEPDQQKTTVAHWAFGTRKHVVKTLQNPGHRSLTPETNICVKNACLHATHRQAVAEKNKNLKTQGQ